MHETLALAALWFGLAALGAVLASVLRLSSALVEIVIGVVAGLVATRLAGSEALGGSLPWITFLASAGSVALTFLAGAELDPDSLRRKWKEANVVGLVGFAAPFLGAAAVARFVLGWSTSSSWLAGIALSTTSMAVVYAVMLDTGLNNTDFGKGILGACFINDLGTVVALGLIFAPFSRRMIVFAIGAVVTLVALPRITRLLTARFSTAKSEPQTRWLLAVTFGLGALALWAGSEAVLTAYVAGMVLAGTVGRDQDLLRRLRTLVIGFLSPVYFIRAGSMVRVNAVAGMPLVFLSLFGAKVGAKIVGLFPTIGLFRRDRKERWYYTLLMSTGLTFGTISSLFGLSHGIIDQSQYSLLVAVVIGSAVVPTLVANAVFLPEHLMPADAAVTGTEERKARG